MARHSLVGVCQNTVMQIVDSNRFCVMLQGKIYIKCQLCTFIFIYSTRSFLSHVILCDTCRDMVFDRSSLFVNSKKECKIKCGLCGTKTILVRFMVFDFKSISLFKVLRACSICFNRYKLRSIVYELRDLEKVVGDRCVK